MRRSARIAGRKRILFGDHSNKIRLKAKSRKLLHSDLQGKPLGTSAEKPWYSKFVPDGDKLYMDYMENEWGYPVFDDRLLFEMLVLEGAQAGLSWHTVLRKREGYRQAFHYFDIEKVAAMTPQEQEKLQKNSGIIRNKLKIKAAVLNAKASLRIIQDHGSLSTYLWSFVNGTPKVNSWEGIADLPTTSDEAIAMSKALKKQGMSFVGPTIIYAFMQACGMVMDHPTGSPQRERLVAHLEKMGLLKNGNVPSK